MEEHEFEIVDGTMTCIKCGAFDVFPWEMDMPIDKCTGILKYCPKCKAPHFPMEVYREWIRGKRTSKQQVERWREVIRRHEEAKDDGEER